MSKKEEQANEERLAAMSQIDPYQFGYKKGSSVTIPAELFMAILDITGAVAQKEQERIVERLSFKQGEQPEESEPLFKIITTDIGFKAEEVFNNTMEVHYSNIDKGFAVNLTAPALDFGDESK